MHRLARGWIAIMLVTALAVAGCVPPAMASSITRITLHVDSTRMDVDGEIRLLDAAPIIIESRTLLPIRAVVEALGGQISWDAIEHKVTILRGSTSIEMWIGQPIALLNGIRTQIDQSNPHVIPLIAKGRTMLPLRFVATALGGEVMWEPTERKITLTFSLERKLTIGEIAEMRKAVVCIDTWGYPTKGALTVSGSGFFISSDGSVVTNYHVIDGATSGAVKLEDGRIFRISRVLGYDKNLDLAIVKIDGTGFPVCVKGDSSKTAVGDAVVAIGSPLGVQNVVSDGIVSKVWDSGVIQATTPISRGSSGGALLNAYGEVIGVTTWKLVNGENMNLAIPVNALKALDTTLNIALEQVYIREYGVPQVPTPTAPADEAEVGTANLTLSWTPVPGADRYAIRILTGRVWANNTVVTSSESTASSFPVPSLVLKAGKTYCWGVRAHNGNGWSEWSEMSHFYTVQAP